MYKFTSIFVILFLVTTSCFGQTSKAKGTWNFNLYTEMYVSHNFSTDQSELPPYFYNHKQLNNLHLNLLSPTLSYASNRFKTTVGLMIGDYSNYNLAHEPLWARNILELHGSFKISKKHAIWLQAGVFPSHIGNETVRNWNNWTLSRNLSSENTPYYSTGISLNFTSKNEKWNLKALALTGWQTIKPTANSKIPSFGTSVLYAPSKKHEFSWNQFIGMNQGKFEQAWRYYSNIFYTFSPLKKLQFFTALDVGLDKNTTHSYGFWTIASASARLNITDHWRMTLRGEFLSDPKQTMMPLPLYNSKHATTLSTVSLNVDWQIHSLALIRLEGKIVHDRFKNYTQKATTFLTTFALQFNLDHKLKRKP